MFEKLIRKHIAVSSLESPDHAVRKDPKIITITWFIGKRCNYDCSYCSPYVHDNYSPHIDKNKAFYFIDQIDNYSTQKNKKFKMNITGGEPFVHPYFIDIIKYIKAKENLSQITSITNGSLTINMYVESLKYLDSLTISLHLEKSDAIINETIEKILLLNKFENKFLNINLMALPGKLEKVKKIIQKFNDNNIKFILRKIDPLPANQNVIKKGDTEKILEERENFIESKIKHKEEVNHNLDQTYNNYYSKEELDFMQNYKNPKQWNNIKLHFPKQTFEMNTDEIKSRNLNNWKNWQCYIGLDSLYIQHTGEIFRGNCMQGNSLGKIGGKINWPTEPIICPVNRCSCNSDMIVRKVKDVKFKKYIDE
jgi:MoaA/NifB/PqqE/SkfB family radical SAM enzyme